MLNVLKRAIKCAVLTNPCGGVCQFVDGTFVVDTLAFVRETGPSTATIISSDGGSTGVTGTVRVSRVRSSTGILSLAGPGSSTPTQAGLTGPVRLPLPTGSAAANAAVFPTGGGFHTGNTTGILVPIRRGVTEVEFVNVAFSPVPLKICKIAGTGITPNTTSFTFTVTQDTAGGLLAPFSSTVTVLAGPRAVNPGDQNGNCDFVSGPFVNPTTNALGSFNFNSTVTITENATPGFVIAPNGISSPTGGIIANVSNGTAFISRLGNGVNEVQFINQSATAPTIKPRKRARFF